MFPWSYDMPLLPPELSLLALLAALLGCALPALPDAVAVTEGQAHDAALAILGAL